MSYVKQESNSIYVYNRYSGSGFCPQSTLNGSSTQRTLLTWLNTKSGESNPSRRKQIARGDNASTDYSKTLHEVLIPGVRCSVYWTEQAWSCPGKKRGLESRDWNAAALSLESSNPSAIALTTADNLARSNAFKAIRDRQTAFQGGVWVGELAETLRLIKGRSRDLFRGVNDYARDVKKHRTRRGHFIQDRLKRASDLWLERAFGWGPMLNDVRNANQFLEKRLNQYNPSYPFVGTGKDDLATSTPGTGSTSDRLKVKFVKNRVTQSRVTYYGRIEGGTVGSGLLFESRLLGFDPSNWIPTVWELIPYSFLVDYFTNCGDVISSWSTCTSGIKWCSKSTKQSYVTHVTDWKWDIDGVKSAMGAAYNTFSPNGSVTSLGKNRVARTVLGRTRSVTLEPPRLTFEIPGLSMKWLNMTALAASRSFA